MINLQRYCIKPTDGQPSTSDPKTWTSYSLALACYQKHSERQLFEYRYRHNRNAPYQHLKCDLAGIGYVFNPEDPLSGVDLDNCIDENGKLKPWAVPIVEKLKLVSYGEVSPSRLGIKFWTKACLPEDIKHKVYITEGEDDAIEAYDSERYFTVTGLGKGDIAEGQAVIDWLVKEYMTPEPTPTPVRTPHPAPQANLKTADEVIQRLRQSRQSHKFDALMRGDTTGYGSSPKPTSPSAQSSRSGHKTQTRLMGSFVNPHFTVQSGTRNTAPTGRLTAR